MADKLKFCCNELIIMTFDLIYLFQIDNFKAINSDIFIFKDNFEATRFKKKWPKIRIPFITGDKYRYTQYLYIYIYILFLINRNGNLSCKVGAIKQLKALDIIPDETMDLTALVEAHMPGTIIQYFPTYTPIISKQNMLKGSYY